MLKNQILKILLLENVHPRAHRIFRDDNIVVKSISGSLGENELSEAIQDVSVLGIRSKTNVTKKVIEKAEKLLAVGAYCIGTNQIDLNACSDRGIVVFNAPFSNTRSVVELVLGEIIMLIRGIFDKSSRLHKGYWSKSANGNHEVRGKKLGIIGYGNIGSQLSVLAESLGMNVYYYDLIDKLALGNARRCDSLGQLLSKCDVVSVHVDGRPENRNLINYKQFEQMKNGVYFLNLSRGFVVNIKALSDNLKSNKVKGAAIDVFPNEPKNNREPFISELQDLPNVIITPHVGGSTEEAQQNIAEFVSNKIMDFIHDGSTMLSVNFPNLQLPEIINAHRLMHVHKNVPGILAKINNILATHSINIVGQYLKTNENIGYVITDISREYERDVINNIKDITGTIRFRIIY
jgi:D-3-phosphoglycerate dehydrogenase